MERVFFQSFVEAFGFRRWQFLLVEVDFLASRNYFFPFLRFPYCGTYFLSSGNALLSESSNLNCGDAFSVLWKPVFLFNLFFNKKKLSLKLVEAHYFGINTLFQLAERDFLSNENCFLLFLASFLQVKTVTETS